LLFQLVETRKTGGKIIFVNLTLTSHLLCVFGSLDSTE